MIFTIRLENMEFRAAHGCYDLEKKVGNRFLAMPSYRNRILGLQLYKFDIEGFLQWGYNFYYAQLSRGLINPYLTTSSEKAFPAGDPFSVYPVKDGAAPSLRAVIFKEALNDVEVCRKLEQYIGKTYCGVKVTRSGLLAGCHLVGIGSMKKALASGEPSYDGYGTPASEYLELFGGYNIRKVWKE